MVGFRRRTMQDPKIQSDTGLLLKGRNYVKLHLFTGKLIRNMIESINLRANSSVP